MSAQLQTQAKTGSKSPDAPTANNAVKRHFSGQRGFSAEAQRYLIQAKLKIGQPGDKYEQEADRVAEQVMRMPEPMAQRQPSWGIGSPSCRDEESIQRKSITHQITPLIQRQESFGEEDEELIQTKAVAPCRAGHAMVATQTAQAVAAGGLPLPQSVRAFFEPRFGRDLSAVRIHTGARAGRTARAINASAYTYHNHIAFADGQYAPGTSAGQRLMAHELVHTVQQSSGTPFIQREVADAGPDASDAGPAPAPAPARKCGPHVETAISNVWRRIQSEFRGWTLSEKRNACLYLITPFVPADPSRPAGRVEANRDAFDTLGLYQDGAEWQRNPPFHPPCGHPGSTNPSADAFSEAHENDRTCSNTVTVGSNCWLMGTVNYGTFGIMMKLCNESMGSTPGAWFGVRLEDFVRRGAEQASDPESEQTDENIRAMAQLARPYMRWVTIAAQIVGSPQLFSLTALRALVRLYKTIDGDDPGPPLSWTEATYNGGHSATPSGTNRANCPATCGLTYNCTPFEYVWEPKQPRGRWDANCDPSRTPPTWSPPTRGGRT